MTKPKIVLIGAGAEAGGSQPGCRMGPAALRTAGLVEGLQSLGYQVEDYGDLALPATALGAKIQSVKYPQLKFLNEAVVWTNLLQERIFQIASDVGSFPLIMGGDHAIAMGSVPALARVAAAQNRPFFVLWLDAHSDYHRLDTTTTGNLHGTPVAYFTGKPSFAGLFPELAATVRSENVALMGIRSVDHAERSALTASGIVSYDMRAIDEYGVVPLLRQFLSRVEAENGVLHVSLDVDYLDPTIAPGVGTTVPGGASFREAHLVMEMLHESALVTSLELVELNPFLDDRGKTARLLVDLTSSLMGRMILDRPTQHHGN